jgi:hypothetical protein
MLILGKEMLSNFYDARRSWSTIGNWSAEESKLTKLGGRASEAQIAGAGYGMAGVAGPYLETFVGSLEYKLGGGGRKVPTILSRRRTFVARHDDVGVASCEVYGPAPLGSIPGNTFEVWTSSAPPPVAAAAAAAAATSNDEREGAGGEDGDDGGEDAAAGEENDGGEICVVLCAGNQNFLSLIDILDNALRRRRRVLAKHHPLRPWLIGPYGVMLGPLIRRGYLAQVLDAGNDATGALLAHPAVGHVHVTGSFRTSRIVRGILRDGRPRGGATPPSDAIVDSMITSELGCATPQILDDGTYTPSELMHAARIIAFGKKSNGGCNCLSAQVVVLPKRWVQKDDFRKALKEELARQPTMPCYYPGSLERKGDMLERCRGAGSDVETVVADPPSEGTRVGDGDHVSIVECGTPGEGGYDPIPLLEEAFGPVLAIVELDDPVVRPSSSRGSGDAGDGDDDYLSRIVVPFLNDKDSIFGSLSCSIYTPSSKGKIAGDRRGLQRALASLQYGCVAVNQWNALGYFTASMGGMWGGHALESRMQSGNGIVGDLYGIIDGDGRRGGGRRSAAKAVVYGPPLTAKPMFDLASPPPTIVYDVLMEFACSPTAFSGAMNALGLVARRCVYGFVSYIPVINAYFK